MTKPMIRIHNQETDEVIDREMNDVEYEQYLKDVAQSKAKKAEEEAKVQAETQLKSKLAALGLTTDDLRALGL